MSYLTGFQIISVLNYTNSSPVAIFPLSLSTGCYLISLDATGLFKVINTITTNEITSMEIQINVNNMIDAKIMY